MYYDHDYSSFKPSEATKDPYPSHLQLWERYPALKIVSTTVISVVNDETLADPQNTFSGCDVGPVVIP
jgi:hypothetical protein